jgi:hypothetical protein
MLEAVGSTAMFSAGVPWRWGEDSPSTSLICSAWSSCPAAPTPISQQVCQPLRRGKAPPESVENGREVSACGLIVETRTHQRHDLPDA